MLFNLINICKEFYSQMHIHKYVTAAYTPKSNGVVERFNKVIVDTLAKHLHNSQDMWDVLGTSSLHSEVRLSHDGCPLQEVPNEKLGAHEGVGQPLGISHHSLCHKL